MNEQQQEMLSALYDGQSSDFETRRVLDALDNEAIRRLRRYQLMGDAVRNQVTDRHCTLDISSQVSAAVAGEPVPRKVSSRFSFKPVVSFAAAASVAFVTVLGVQQLRPSEGIPGTKGSFVADGDVSASQLPISAGDLGLSTVSGSTSSLVLPERDAGRENLQQVTTDHMPGFMLPKARESSDDSTPSQSLLMPAASQ